MTLPAISLASGNVSSMRMKLGSPWTSTWSKCPLISATVSSSRPGFDRSCRMSRSEVKSFGLGSALAMASSSGSSSPKRTCRRPKGKALDDDDIGLRRREGFQQQRCAAP